MKSHSPPCRTCLNLKHSTPNLYKFLHIQYLLKGGFLVSFPLRRQTAQPQHPQLIEVKELDHQHSTNTQNRAKEPKQKMRPQIRMIWDNYVTSICEKNKGSPQKI